MARLRIRVTRHLVARMTARGIGFDLLRDTIRNPDTIEPAGERRIRAVRRWDRGTCVAVCEHITGLDVRAITVYYRRW